MASPTFPSVCNGLFYKQNFPFLLILAWLIETLSCFFVNLNNTKNCWYCVAQCQSGSLKTICSFGLREEKLPFIDRKAVLSNLSSARHKNRAMAVTRISLEELKESKKKRGPICCRAGNCFVGGVLFFLTCPYSLLNKYYFVHAWFCFIFFNISFIKYMIL